MILALLAALQIAQAADTTMPSVTLAEALREATQFDPNYVQAAGTVAEAEWVRRAAMLVFVLPSLNATADFQSARVARSFNPSTGSFSSLQRHRRALEAAMSSSPAAARSPTTSRPRPT